MIFIWQNPHYHQKKFWNKVKYEMTAWGMVLTADFFARYAMARMMRR
jgi:hypothetical protein